VGSLIKLKRFDIFLELVSSLKKEMPGIQAVLIGDGPERENLTRQWTKLDLQDNLSMPGSLPFEKVMEYLQHSKVLLHPSSYEGFSCVCMEAQAAGAHVIRFNNPMNHDMVQWHIAGNKEDMLRMARELISDPGTRYECLHSFTMSAAINALMALY
jgi:glycosyltransferase involved in cell wall biosynthesis